MFIPAGVAAGSKRGLVAIMLAGACSGTLLGCAEAQLGLHATKSLVRTAGDAGSGASGGSPEFSAAGYTVWDGADTGDGFWVAHPLATTPQIVQVTNTATGRTATATMSPREPNRPGPSIIVSSQVARTLGLARGAPTRISIAARAVEPAPVYAGAAPDPSGPIQTAALIPPPVAARAPAPMAARDAHPETASVAVAASLPLARLAQSTAVPTPLPRPVRVSAPAVEPEAASVITPRPRPARRTEARAAARLPDAYLQVGSFAQDENAALLVERLKARGQNARSLPGGAEGRPLSIVLIGPLASPEARLSAQSAAEAEGVPDTMEVTL